MTKSLTDLISKNKPLPAAPAVVEEPKAQELAAQKQNAFAALKKSTDKPKPLFNINKQAAALSPHGAAKGEVAGSVDAAGATPPSIADATSPTNSELATVLAAEEFIHADQPDNMAEDAVGQLRQSLQVLKDSLEHPEIVSEAIKNVMINLQKHEFLRDSLADEDYRTMVKGLRASYGTTIAKKQEKKTKRSENNQKVTDAIGMLQGLSLNIG